jgi:methylglutaconyl-CoA hydratase
MTIRRETRVGTCRILLDRPDCGNAYDAEMIDALADAIRVAEEDPAVRVIVVAGSGRHLSTGPSAAFLAAMDAGGLPARIAEADRAMRLLSRFDTCAKVTVVRVEGAAVGLIAGLVAAADVAIAADDAEFAVPDVRHGHLPAAVAPWFVRAMGLREARRLLLTGDRMRAHDARAASLVHEVVPRTALDAAVDRAVISLTKGDAGALDATKTLLSAAEGPISATMLEEMRRRLVDHAGAMDATGRRGAA